jgi:hypothetical protein
MKCFSLSQTKRQSKVDPPDVSEGPQPARYGRLLALAKSIKLV